jgi:glycolate oxidase
MNIDSAPAQSSSQVNLEKRKNELLKLFRDVLDDDAIISDVETQKPYECDGLAMYCAMPLLVVMPETVPQVQAIMRICHEKNVPVVARGAGTGLSAGSTPHEQGVLLSMTRFSRILRIDPEACTATLQPGVRNLEITETAAIHGLYYAPDPSSQIACSIGGNVAENSGGVHCLKYGLTLHNVLKVQMVTADGECIEIGSEGLDSSGPDLLALMIGSEGMLGVVTEVTVKLLPKPEEIKVILAGFDSVEKAGDSVSQIIAGGIIPAGLEMMDSLSIITAEAYAHAGYPTDAQALLLCEIDGTREEVEEHIATISALLKEAGATSIRVSQTDAEKELLWKGRKSAFPAVGRISSDYYCMDGTIPRSKIAQVLTEIHAMSERHALRVANVFHAGDGNLHPLILFDANDPDEWERAKAFGSEILALCVEVGGCITGEHGVGLEKMHDMLRQFNDAEIEQFLAVKHAFDTAGILNPGKTIPTLKYCQEYRALSALNSEGGTA